MRNPRLAVAALLALAVPARARDVSAPPLGELRRAGGGGEVPNSDEDNAGELQRTAGASAKPRSLDEIRKSGTLRVITRNNATSFFIYRGHRMGMDYELAKRLAQRLKIRAEMVVPESWGDVIPALLRGEGDVVAAELTVTDERKKQVDFADAYMKTREVVVYKKGTPAVEKAEDLSGREVTVRPGSSYHETLVALNAKLAAAGKAPVVIKDAPEDEETERLFAAVAKGDAKYTLADEQLAKIDLSDYEDLVTGAAVSDERELAWAVRPGEKALLGEINAMLRELKKAPDFNILKKKYFEDERGFEKRDNDKYNAGATGTLSPYDPQIYKVAQEFGFDWRQFAAQIYQESHFDPKRESWAGAVGLFQLMPATARGLGVTDPEDPEQSIRGGAKYMRQLMDHYEDVKDPVERYRFALAAYNAGLHHVDDARELAIKAKENPADWKLVSKWLLKLADHKVCAKTRFGFCKGGEPVDYVRHINERYTGYCQLVPATRPQGAK